MNRERIEDLAVLYSSGELSEDELADFKAWRASATVDELAWFAEIVDGAGEIAASEIDPVAPPPAVKDQLMAKLGFGDGGIGDLAFEFKTEAQEEGEWEELPVKGARIRRLSDHEEDGHTVFLLELDPDTTFPSHVHKGAECAYVLSGDLEIEGRFLREGDFSRAAPGSQHRSLYSRDGCRALLITARKNFPRRTMNAYTGLRKLAAKIGKVFGGTRDRN